MQIHLSSKNKLRIQTAVWNRIPGHCTTNDAVLVLGLDKDMVSSLDLKNELDNEDDHPINLIDPQFYRIGMKLEELKATQLMLY